METTVQQNRHVRFGPFELNLASRELSQNGLKVRLQGHPMDVLVLLLEHPGEVVSREFLQKRLWPQDTFVDFEHGLNVTINRLREALGDQAEEPQFIETVPRVGYRFIGVIEISSIEASPLPKEAGAPSSAEPNSNPIIQAKPQVSTAVVGTRMRRALTILGATLALTFAAGGVWRFYRLPPPPRVTNYVRISRDSYGRYLAGTDGANLYFWELPIPPRLPWIAISGGGVLSIPVNLFYPRVLDVSPDGSRLLVVALGENSAWAVWSVRVSDGSLRRVVNADAISGAWSNDGKMIALLTNYGDILRMQSDGTDLHTLATLPDRTRTNFVRLMAWSPDGRTIRFTRDLRLWEIASDGSNPHPLLPAWRPSAGQCCGRWTPDGRFFIFLSFEPRAVAGTARGAQLFLLDERRTILGRSNREPVQLTAGPIGWDRPIVSKDGKMIFARGIVLHGQLTRYDIRSQQFQPFLGGIAAEWVAFSPDGNSVAYVTFPEGILWKAKRDGSEPVQLTDKPWYPQLPRWSPDGSQILFSDQDQNGVSHAYVIPSMGGNPTPLLPEIEAYQGDPSWSPDGKKVVFDFIETAGSTTSRTLRIFDLVTRKVSTLPESQDARSARWSPDGRFIAALFHRPDELHVYDFESQKWTLLRKQRTGFPNWSRDGSFLYFLNGMEDRGIYRIRPTGGAAELVLDLRKIRQTGIAGPWVGLDPDDNPMLLRETGTDDIYALTLEWR